MPQRRSNVLAFFAFGIASITLGTAPLEIIDPTQVDPIAKFF
jgi:hypothetical protein